MQNFSPFSVKNYLVLYDFGDCLYIRKDMLFFLGGSNGYSCPPQNIKWLSPKAPPPPKPIMGEPMDHVRWIKVGA